MIRKILVLLETGVVMAGLLLGLALWQLYQAVQQPLEVALELFVD
ncbi:aminodeoxychorismate lyase, partial [Pseudomonas syringae pv. tagetis]